jgi:hypothetical protein
MSQILPHLHEILPFLLEALKIAAIVIGAIAGLIFIGILALIILIGASKENFFR